MKEKERDKGSISYLIMLEDHCGEETYTCSRSIKN